MPGIITHHVFGAETYERLSGSIGTTAAEREAFLLGNQGPDPLLCLRLLPQKAKHRKLGAMMHSKSTAWLLSSIHDHFTHTANAHARSVLKAYGLGFLCHFFLDSTVHPLVYAQQYAIFDSGVEGLASGKKGVVHAAIETELDEYVLATHRGCTVSDYVPHREALKCSAVDLARISAAFVPVVKSTYGIEVPAGLFANSVRMYRSAQAALDSKRDGLRKRFDYARLSGVSYQHVQAMTHVAQLRTETPYANGEHIPWPHPFVMGAVVDASFDELYERALEKAAQYAARFVRADFTSADCVKMTGGINFRGQLIGRLQKQ